MYISFLFLGHSEALNGILLLMKSMEPNVNSLLPFLTMILFYNQQLEINSDESLNFNIAASILIFYSKRFDSFNDAWTSIVNFTSQTQYEIPDLNNHIQKLSAYLDSKKQRSGL